MKVTGTGKLRMHNGKTFEFRTEADALRFEECIDEGNHESLCLNICKGAEIRPTLAAKKEAESDEEKLRLAEETARHILEHLKRNSGGDDGDNDEEPDGPAVPTFY